MGKVVILIITHKSDLNIYEQISLKQCYNILGHFPIKIICPEGLDVSFYKAILPDPQFDFIDPNWQSSYENFNKLKINPFLYQKYNKYRYILFYEPDAFVLSNELDYWCDEGYDFIGAPWFEGFSEADDNSEIIGIGNGGFSLRNIEKSLHIMKQLKTIETLDQCSKFKQAQIINIIKTFYYWWKTKGHLAVFVENFNENEDLFWTVKSHERIRNFRKNTLMPGIFKKFFFKGYNLAPVERAIEFSFEKFPGRLFELNSFRLPFGCHAWWKYDLEFWKPHIEKFGYKLPENIQT